MFKFTRFEIDIITEDGIVEFNIYMRLRELKTILKKVGFYTELSFLTLQVEKRKEEPQETPSKTTIDFSFVSPKSEKNKANRVLQKLALFLTENECPTIYNSEEMRLTMIPRQKEYHKT